MAAARGPGFRGRISERQVLDRLLDDARSGASAVLVVRGEPGIGKTALLRYCARQASGFRVAQLAGVESEMELPYAALHQLCAPMLARLDALPEPQQDALRVAFGLASGEPPDRFLVALATLGLLAEVAAERPVLCLVDDAQWLDNASSVVLGFVARRLLAEPIAIVFGVRQRARVRELTGLPELALRGLAEDEARALLAAVYPGRLDHRIRDRIVAETRGNPLALVELPRGMSAVELAGGFPLLGGRNVPGQIEEHYLRRLATLPEPARRLVLLAAAEPTGDVFLLWHAAQALGIERDAAVPAERERLLEIGTQVRFRHPLVRSAVYRVASAPDRRAVHLALAGATDATADPDRRAWHLAAAAAGPDDDVAAELERSAGRAQARGGLAAAAAFLERSAALTRDPARRADRALAAVQAHLHAGGFDAALVLLSAAQAGPLDDFQRARVQLLRGQIAFASGAGNDAPPLLLEAARLLEAHDGDLARETYLDAWAAALFAGSLATAGDLLEVSRAARSVSPPARASRPCDLLLDGLAVLTTEGRAAAEPLLKRAIGAYAAAEVAEEANFRWGWLTTVPCNVLWDDESWHTINTRQVQLARDAGALARLPIDLTASAILLALWGDFDAAAAAIAEAHAVTEATSSRIAPYGAMLLAALRGREGGASAVIQTARQDATAVGQGIGVQYSQWVSAILYNGLGRYEDAFAAARHASDDAPELFLSAWSLAELIEASARCGRPDVGSGALERLEESTASAGNDWALGIEARSRALLGAGNAAEHWYRDAIERLSRTRLRTEHARAHLVYGEWLRRRNRRVDARDQLHVAHDMLTLIGMEAFADRARRELLATGEKVRKRRDDTRAELTPQEAHIARLARDGRTNPEIGAELYISARTVEWHLRKVFTKLGITSRKGLHEVLPTGSRDGSPT
jgi:DNA-binding CsgD family transcriptional regulator/tetratricopeptide (TPR) repeat protein